MLDSPARLHLPAGGARALTGEACAQLAQTELDSLPAHYPYATLLRTRRQHRGDDGKEVIYRSSINWIDQSDHLINRSENRIDQSITAVYSVIEAGVPPLSYLEFSSRPDMAYYRRFHVRSINQSIKSDRLMR